MNEDTKKIYDFLLENGYIEERPYQQINVKIVVDDVPEITATYLVINSGKADK